jgi:hypothetical protein
MCIIFEVKKIKGRNGHEFLMLDLPRISNSSSNTGKTNSVALHYAIVQ